MQKLWYIFSEKMLGTYKDQAFRIPTLIPALRGEGDEDVSIESENKQHHKLQEQLINILNKTGK